MSQTSVIENLAATEAILNYLVPTSERPRSYAYEPPANQPQTNIRNVAIEVPIRDARPIVGEITLDRHGFELVKHRSAVRDFYEDDDVKRVYYPEAVRLLKAATGASRVFVFDHVTRRRTLGAEGTREGVRQPVTRVHVDHTARSGPSGCAIFLPTRQTSCSMAVCRSSTCGARSGGRCSTRRSRFAMPARSNPTISCRRISSIRTGSARPIR
jgi:hypothetical protein